MPYPKTFPICFHPLHPHLRWMLTGSTFMASLQKKLQRGSYTRLLLRQSPRLQRLTADLPRQDHESASQGNAHRPQLHVQLHQALMLHLLPQHYQRTAAVPRRLMTLQSVLFHEGQRSAEQANLLWFHLILMIRILACRLLLQRTAAVHRRLMALQSVLFPEDRGSAEQANPPWSHLIPMIRNLVF